MNAASVLARNARVRFYKRHRGLLHTGTVVNADHPDPAIWISGVVSPDRSRALPDWVKDTQVVPGLVLAQAGFSFIALRPNPAI